MTTRKLEGTSGQSTRHMSGGYADTKAAQLRFAQLTPPPHRNRQQRRQIKQGQK